MFSNLFIFAGAKLSELNNMISKDCWVKYIFDSVKFVNYSMECGFIEDYIRRCLQSGVRHEIKNRLIGLYSKEFIEGLFSTAKSVTEKSQTSFLDSCFIEEKILKAIFDADNMPELKTQKWWEKEYFVLKKVGKNKETTLVEKFKAEISKITFKYNPESKELVLSMKFKVFKWAVLGGVGDWTESG